MKYENPDRTLSSSDKVWIAVMDVEAWAVGRAVAAVCRPSPTCEVWHQVSHSQRVADLLADFPEEDNKAIPRTNRRRESASGRWIGWLPSLTCDEPGVRSAAKVDPLLPFSFHFPSMQLSMQFPVTANAHQSQRTRTCE